MFPLGMQSSSAADCSCSGDPNEAMTLFLNQKTRDDWVASIAARMDADTAILDVGAGQCRYRDMFAHCDYQAQDLGEYAGTADGLFQETWAYGELDFASDITSIPVDAASFDAVLCTEVLEHVLDPIAAIGEMSRILRPGGCLYLSAPLGSGLHQEPYHFYGGFTPHFYKEVLKSFDLSIVSITPNGQFFQLLAQELERAESILTTRGGLRRWHPTRLLVRALADRRVTRRLLALDRKMPVAEFTVGYHVEALKSAENRA
jgi:SAM-dependent methyltransferase